MICQVEETKINKIVDSLANQHRGVASIHIEIRTTCKLTLVRTCESLKVISCIHLLEDLHGGMHREHPFDEFPTISRMQQQEQDEQ